MNINDAKGFRSQLLTGNEDVFFEDLEMILGNRSMRKYLSKI